MTMPNVPVMLFHPEYGNFLYATVREDSLENPLSMISALARLGVDPWDEAAELSGMTLAAAKSRLASLLERLPASNETMYASVANVSRLLMLLPSAKNSIGAQNGQVLTRPSLGRQTNRIVPPVAALVMCIVFALSFLMMHSAEKAVPANGDSTGTAQNR